MVEFLIQVKKENNNIITQLSVMCPRAEIALHRGASPGSGLKIPDPDV